MKKLAALLLLLAAVPAWGKMRVLDGGFFTMSVPVVPAERADTDWTVTLRGVSSASVTPPDRSFVITINVFDAAAPALRGLAERVAQAHGAREVVKMDGDGEAYEYKGTSAGLPVYAQVFSLDGGRSGYVAITGDHQSAAASAAFNSIRFKKAEPQTR